MRPYLAIIRDSFREALASRVLWILFVLITLLLLALAPLGYRQTVTRGLDENAVENWPQFIELLRDESAKTALSPSLRLVSLLNDETKKKVAEFKFPDANDTDNGFKFMRSISEIRRAINKQLERRDFYDAKYWEKTPLISGEARKFAKSDIEKLSDDDIARFNRLLMESAYPSAISPGAPTSLNFFYLWFDPGVPLPIRKADFNQFLKWFIPEAMNWLVGGLGVFVAILVTSTFIPQTFDPGVLNLMLSKPIHRSLVFLSKFLGGCIFITINVTYLICGIYLFLGVRFANWDTKLFWCIPIYVFVFAIYYSVSAVAGLIWRNAIVSVVIGVLFWAVCFFVGVVKISIEEKILIKWRIVNVIAAHDDLIAVNEVGSTYLWDKTNNDWLEIVVPTSKEDVERRMAMLIMPSIPTDLHPIGPVYDAKHEQLISACRSLRNGQMMLSVGRRSDQWKNIKGTNASLGTVALLREADGTILTISSLGLYRLAGDPTMKPEPVKVFGFSLPLPADGPFESVGPESGFVVARPVDAKINDDNGTLAVFSRGTLSLLEKKESGRYEVLRSKDLKLESNRSAILGIGGKTLLVGHEDGRIAVMNPSTLEEIHSFSPEANTPPRFITVSPHGDYFAIVFHNGDLWMYDAQRNEMTKARVTDQGDVSSAAFSAPDRLLVSHHTTRVTEYDVKSWKRLDSHAPPMTLSELIYRYGIAPLYYVCPKPGELNKTIQYVLTGKETIQSGNDRQDLAAAQQNLHPWRPVVSGFVFMLVVLSIGCLYIERQEF